MKRALKSLILSALTLMTLMVCSAGLLSVHAADTDVIVNVTYQQTEARSMLAMVNDFRTGSEAWYYDTDGSKVRCAGLSEYVYDYGLEKVAMQRAAEIALNFSHTRPNGERCFSAYTDGLCAGGENIAAGYGSAAAAFTAWQETNCDYSGQGHRRNMLDSQFVSIGIACVYYEGYYYWVQEFAYNAPNPSAVPANNKSTDVTVSVSGGSLSVSGIDSISLYCGCSKTVPKPSATLLMDESWPYSPRPVSLSCTWTSSDPAVVTVSGSRLTGKSAGTAVISAAAGGKKISVPVAVTYKPGYSFTVSRKTYTVLSSKTVAFTKTTSTAATLTIPSSVTISGITYAVTAVSDSAVKGNARITWVKIPASVTKIGESAFSGCAKLKTVIIGSKVSTIGRKAFFGCKALSKLTLPASVKDIGAYAFRNCSALKSVRIKTTKLTNSTVGIGAFAGLNARAVFTVPSSKLTAYKRLLKVRGVTGKHQTIKS